MIVYSIWATIGILCVAYLMWKEGGQISKQQLIFGLIVGSIGGLIWVFAIWLFHDSIKNI